MNIHDIMHAYMLARGEEDEKMLERKKEIHVNRTRHIIPSSTGRKKIHFTLSKWQRLMLCY